MLLYQAPGEAPSTIWVVTLCCTLSSSKRGLWSSWVKVLPLVRAVALNVGVNTCVIPHLTQPSLLVFSGQMAELHPNHPHLQCYCHSSPQPVLLLSDQEHSCHWPVLPVVPAPQHPTDATCQPDRYCPIIHTVPTLWSCHLCTTTIPVTTAAKNPHWQCHHCQLHLPTPFLSLCCHDLILSLLEKSYLDF